MVGVFLTKSELSVVLLLFYYGNISGSAIL